MPAFRRVALLSPPFSTLTYGVPGRFSGWDLPPGLRVAVPVGRSLRAGVIAGADVLAPEGVKMKDILWPLEHAPLITEAYLDMARNLAARQMSQVGQVLSSLIPAGLKSARATLVGRGAMTLAPAVAGRTARSGRLKIAFSGLDQSSEEELAGLAVAWRGGELEVAVAATARDKAYGLAVDPPWPVRPGATAQLAVLEHLYERGQATAKDLRALLGPRIAPALAVLESKGFITLGPPAEEPDELQDDVAPGPRPPLTPEQHDALLALLPLLDAGRGGERLVHGVTGSGKTRLYFELAEACLAKGRSVLLLAPEVVLAQALRSRARAWFAGLEPVFSHGSQGPTRRERTFRELAGSRTPKLVVGTRSALFLPVPDIGLIILDEEHDASFKQDERMSYQAKEVAFFRARQSGALLVLGSATPDVKTYHAAREGLTPMVVMANRVGASRPPDIELVDMAGRNKAVQLTPATPGDGAGLLAETSLAALKETLARGEQAIILQNRRGYAPLLFCQDCEKVLRCPSCEVSLTYHKLRERLVCHYCGGGHAFPRPCPHCGGTNFLPMGEGAEMLAEHITAALPPETVVGRLDRDIARRAGRAEAILEDFARGKTQVLVGTQMLSKGHDFPQVTLVLVADGDMGLNMPDYRAPERAFQMLVQVAGRAGRGDKPGRVLIQTRNPGDPFWTFVKTADFQGFFEQELEKRRRYGYPPFVKLGLVRASFPRDWDQGGQVMTELAQALRAAGGGVRVLGPAPAPVAVVRDRKRFHCLLKAQDWVSIRTAYAEAARRLAGVAKLRLALDLDPVDML